MELRSENWGRVYILGILPAFLTQPSHCNCCNENQMVL